MTDQSEGWRAGDLAVCISNIGWWDADSQAAAGPDAEQIVRVAEVYGGVAGYPGGVGLEFDEFPDNLYPASAFRKVHPDHSPADDVEIVALIKRAGAEVPA